MVVFAIVQNQKKIREKLHTPVQKFPRMTPPFCETMAHILCVVYRKLKNYAGNKKKIAYRLH